MSKTNRTGRGGKAPRHVRLYYWMTDSHAWHDLSALERAMYAEIAKLYDGSNNGKIWYSVRTAADEFRVGKSTAWRAIRRLIEHGFLVQMKRGAFSLKQKHATEWRLTEFPCDVSHDIASKDFMRWKPPSKIQNAVSPQTSSVPVAKPIGTCSETEDVKNGPVGTCSETEKPNFSVSRFHHRYTDKLPGGGQPVGEADLGAAQGPGMGHNLGPPLENDLIPEFLRRDPNAACWGK